MIKRSVVSLLLLNGENQLLLMLRDDKPSIPFPNHWAFIGGDLELNETPENALKREIIEELGVEISDFKFYKHYFLDSINYFVYFSKTNLQVSDFELGEGQALRYFNEFEIKNICIGFRNRDIIIDFYKDQFIWK